MLAIRPYRREDRSALRQLALQLHETMRPLDADLAPGEDIIDRYFRDLLSRVDETSGAIFVAEERFRIAEEVDCRLVGYVCVFGSVTSGELDERSDRYSFMAELFVHPEFRNEGIGSDLVEQAEDFARRCGAYKMELTVLGRNEAAIRFYERHGYAARTVVMSKRL